MINQIKIWNSPYFFPFPSMLFMRGTENNLLSYFLSMPTKMEGKIYCLPYYFFSKKILSYYFSKVITRGNISNHFLKFLFLKLSFEDCNMLLLTLNKNLVMDNFLIIIMSLEWIHK